MAKEWQNNTLHVFGHSCLVESQVIAWLLTIQQPETFYTGLAWYSHPHCNPLSESPLNPEMGESAPSRYVLTIKAASRLAKFFKISHNSQFYRFLRKSAAASAIGKIAQFRSVWICKTMLKSAFRSLWQCINLQNHTEFCIQISKIIWMNALVPLNTTYFIESLWVIKSAPKQNGLNLRSIVSSIC